MKTIILIRHAKSDRPLYIPNDIDRPLNQRGYADSYTVSEKLKTDGTTIDLIISSPAIRAFTTALIFSRTLQYSENKIKLDERFYVAEGADYSDLLMEVDDEINCVAVFAHNPAISDALSILTGAKTEELPTCAVSVLHSELKSWTHIAGAKFKLSKQIFPKMLRQ